MPYYANKSQSSNVYLREIDLSHRISGASTSIGAVVGFANKGPVMIPTLVTNTQEFVDWFGTPHPSLGFMHYTALAFLRQSSALYVVRADTHALTAGAYVTVDDPLAINPNWSLDVFNDGSGNPLGIYDPMSSVGYIESDPLNPNSMFFVAVENPGEWNNNLMINIKPTNPTGYAPGEMNDPTEFYLEVYENYQGVNDYPLERFKVCRYVKVDGYGNPLFIEDVVNKKSKYIRVRNNPFSNPMIPVNQPAFVFLRGGTNGNAITPLAVSSGWDLFSDPEEITVNILMNGGYTEPGVQTKMDSIAKKRMDSVAVLDMPSDSQQTLDAVNYRRSTLNLNSSYSALYTPDVKIYDRYNDMSLYVPPSGYMGAVMAYTDQSFGVFYAPAGVRRGTLPVDDLRFKYNLAKRDALDEAQINMIRLMPNGSYTVWNQSTLQSSLSSLSFLNVRRLMNYIEKTISKALITDLFDPNDSSLRSSIVAKISFFLNPIKLAGGLGAYRVVCDNSNNTNDTIANGDLIVDIIIDAESVLPVKRLLLRATVNRTGARVSA